MWNSIWYNWNLFRILRLGMGGFIIWEGIKTGTWVFTVLGALFSLLPLLNIGCCTTGNCTIPRRKSHNAEAEIVYEEVKAKP